MGNSHNLTDTSIDKRGSKIKKKLKGKRNSSIGKMPNKKQIHPRCGSGYGHSKVKF